MAKGRGAGQEQAELWNNRGGRAWVEAEEMLDNLFRPQCDTLAEEVGRRPSSRVLDVGCGTGATTVAAAQRLGERGSCTGIDISEPMVTAARARAERERAPARFLLGDAGTHRFEPSSFDLLISRFGVMFFADPVLAFTNLRRAAADGAELRFIVWRDPEENPFMTAAERAAAPLLPDLPPRQPGAPGQFALADPDRVRAILTDSGWTSARLEPVDFSCAMPEPHFDHYLAHLGPVGRALQAEDEPTRTRVLETIRPAFDPYVQAGEARFTAACWMLEARAAGSG